MPTTGSGRAWPACSCIGDRLEVVGSAGQAGPALDVVVATHPDIVVIDPRLPEMDGGLSFIARLRASHRASASS